MDTIDWQDRVIQERQELGQKCVKLYTFLEGPGSKLPYSDRKLLQQQLRAMEEYRMILDTRIEAFGLPETLK